jgi:hypothetical protein
MGEKQRRGMRKEPVLVLVRVLVVRVLTLLVRVHV